MTPEQAQEIYHDAAMVEYEKHRSNYDPVNQQKVALAGFQGVIDAVTAEIDIDYAKKYLEVSQ